MDAEVRATTSSGYVPATVLATIRQPMLWANGSVDRQVPTGLFENPDGLESDQTKTTKLARSLWDLIVGFLARTVGGTS